VYLINHKTKNNFAKAWQDLIGSFSHWRIFCLIGINDIRKRYSRSKMGQFWLTLSLAINIGALSVVWAFLLKMPVKEYLPYLAVGTIFWTYISSCILEGSNLYISNTSYLKDLSIPKLSYLNCLFIRNLVIALHNLLVLIPVYLFCSIPLSIASVSFSILGLVLCSMFLYAIIMFMSLISLRFRDLPNIIASVLQISFYVTPIMWKTEAMPEHVQKYMVFNPFAVFLTICRDPLLNITVPNEYWLVAGTYTIIAWIVAFPFFSKFRARITYWL
jgi:lipopolysaccharide transport system permease protein